MEPFQEFLNTDSFFTALLFPVGLAELKSSDQMHRYLECTADLSVCFRICFVLEQILHIGWSAVLC